MAGYSGKPLAEKLGIKEGFKIVTVNQPGNYLELIAPIPQGVTVSSHLADDVDIIHYFAQSRAGLAGDIEELIPRIKQNGMIWVSWPKKSSRMGTDLTGDGIREITLPLGLVDVKVVAVDETWSGLKLVIRKEHRV